MKIIVVCKYLPAQGMALFPFLIVKKAEYKHNADLIRHEQIHFKQQIELLLLPFYLLYLLYYAYYLAKYKDKNKAYHAIPFEKEAYAHDTDAQYLKQRKIFAWWQYH